MTHSVGDGGLAPITASTHGTWEDCFAAAMADRRRLYEALINLKAAFSDPITRRALGGHSERQMAAVLAAAAAIQSATGEG